MGASRVGRGNTPTSSSRSSPRVPAVGGFLGGFYRDFHLLFEGVSGFWVTLIIKKLSKVLFFFGVLIIVVGVD